MRSAALAAERVGEVAQAPLECFGELPDGVHQFVVAFLGREFSLLGVFEELVELVGPVAQFPLVHVDEGSA